MQSETLRGFILGSRRSGSNLLRVLLNQSPYLSAPHPPHILHAFMPILAHYSDLEDDDNWQRLVKDVVDYVNLSPVPMLDSGELLDWKPILAAGSPRNLVWLQDAIYREIASRNGKQHWICKSNDNILYLDEIQAAFGKSARYIYLYRDGRDVAMSFRKAPIGYKHPYLCALEWDNTQRIMLHWIEQHPEQSLRVRYESLVSDTEATLATICAFLEVPFDAGMIDYHTSQEAERTASKSVLWANLTKPVQKDNTGKWRSDHPDNIHAFERGAGGTLELLGYPVLRGMRPAPTPEELAHILAEDTQRRIEIVQSLGGDGGRRNRQADFLERLKGGRHIDA